MTKETFEMVKQLLTTHAVWANDTDYSLSLKRSSFDDSEFFRITVFPNRPQGTFPSVFALFFCQIAEVCNCTCSFRAINDTCICCFF